MCEPRDYVDRARLVPLRRNDTVSELVARAQEKPTRKVPPGKDQQRRSAGVLRTFALPCVDSHVRRGRPLCLSAHMAASKRMSAAGRAVLEVDSLEELEAVVRAANAERLRVELLANFERLVGYQTLAEWNQLVRTCEALSLVGWGEREAIEAVAEKWVNGSWYTSLRNGRFEKIASAPDAPKEVEWSRSGESFVIRGGKAAPPSSPGKFASQRNRLPKNPLRLVQGVANHQRSAAPFVEALEVLRQRLDRELRPEAYGSGFGYVGIVCSFSTHDDQHETVRSEYFHDPKDVPRGFKGKHFIRPRLDIGKLALKDGQLRCLVRRHFTRREGELPLPQQKALLVEDLASILDALAGKLAKKKVAFDVPLLRADLASVLATW